MTRKSSTNGGRESSHCGKPDRVGLIQRQKESLADVGLEKLLRCGDNETTGPSHMAVRFHAKVNRCKWGIMSIISPKIWYFIGFDP